MDSIAVTKPDMGALPRGRLTVSPFGVLSHAFTRELLARSSFEEGRWPFVPLDLLEEGEPAPSGPPVQPVVQVDLSLILQAMRRTENRAEWEKAAERIVERVIVLEKRGRGPAAPVRTDAQRPPQASGQGTDLRPARGEKRAPGPEPADSAAAPPAVRQSFYNTVNQHIRFTANLIRYEAAGGLPDGPAFRRTAPGGLRGHASGYFRQGALSRGERTGSALPGDFTEARALGEAAGPVLWAGDGPDRRTRAQGRIGARAAARWNPGDAAPEALFHPEGGGDIGTTGTDAAAAIQRGAQRIAGQLAALWTAGHPRAGGRPGGGPSGRVAAPEAVEGLRLPPRTRFEPILSRDGTAPAVLLDGLHRMQTAQGADRTAGWPWPSLTVRRRLEPRSAPARAGLTDSQRPETGGQPGEVTLPDSRSRTRTPRWADAVQGADRLSPDGALAGRELRPRALTARDIRLNAAPPMPPEGPAAGGLPEGELSHWARPEEERTLGQPLPPGQNGGENRAETRRGGRDPWGSGGAERLRPGSSARGGGSGAEKGPGKARKRRGGRTGQPAHGAV